MEKLKSSKPVKFYLRRIKKRTDQWQEVIQNNDKYIMDFNLFIVELFINKIYFDNSEIIYNSSQYIFLGVRTRERVCVWVCMCVCVSVCMCVCVLDNI